MQLSEAIFKRRSIRKFSSLAIAKKHIENIVESACWAPSACDRQAWRFIIVDDHGLKKRIVEAGGADFIQDAPVGILVLYDNRSDNLEYRDYIQSAAAAIQNMLLKATELGIGSCWVCHLPLKSCLRKIFKIPSYYDPIAYLVLGYYEQEPKSGLRRHQISEIISYNVFNFKEDSSPCCLELLIRKILRATYLNLPLCCKKILAPLAEKFVKKFN